MTTYVSRLPSNEMGSAVSERNVSIESQSTQDFDPNDSYRKTQSQIYSLQETILDSSKKNAKLTPKSVSPEGNEGQDVIAHPDFSSPIESIEPSRIDSLPILKYTKDKYNEEPELIGELIYSSTNVGRFIRYGDDGTLESTHETTLSGNITLPFPYDFESHYTPAPCLPPFSRDNINKLIKIKISYDDILGFLDGRSRRFQNMEIWGSDIYTDDTDPLLALKHVGFFEDFTSDNEQTKRTIANIHNSDNVFGNLYLSKEYEIEMTVLLLDCLQAYVGVDRFGISARNWFGSVAHDGLSYGIYEINIKNPTEKVDISQWK